MSELNAGQDWADDRYRSVVLAIGGTSCSEHVVEEAKQLACALDCAWEAVHVELPGSSLAQDQATARLLAVAGPDGRNPIRADQAVTMSTIVAKASLAHERLRLEDEIRAGVTGAS
jgi:hypothetical protein